MVYIWKIRWQEVIKMDLGMLLASSSEKSLTFTLCKSNLTKKILDIQPAARNCFLVFKTLFAHCSLPTWCISGNRMDKTV